jgi:hypothetical protein
MTLNTYSDLEHLSKVVPVYLTVYVSYEGVWGTASRLLDSAVPILQLLRHAWYASLYN